jgi:putative addiction module component (TIGR02574 family)
MKTEFPEVFALSVEKKLELLGELWDSLSPEDVPVPDWHIEELNRRKQAQDRNPDGGQSWEEAKRQILNGQGK